MRVAPERRPLDAVGDARRQQRGDDRQPEHEPGVAGADADRAVAHERTVGRHGGEIEHLVHEVEAGAAQQERRGGEDPAVTGQHGEAEQPEREQHAPPTGTPRRRRGLAEPSDEHADRQRADQRGAAERAVAPHLDGQQHAEEQGGDERGEDEGEAGVGDADAPAGASRIGALAADRRRVGRRLAERHRRRHPRHRRRDHAGACPVHVRVAAVTGNGTAGGATRTVVGAGLTGPVGDGDGRHGERDDRRLDEEDRPPVEQLGERAAERRTECRADGPGQCPRATAATLAGDEARRAPAANRTAAVPRRHPGRRGRRAARSTTAPRRRRSRRRRTPPRRRRRAPAPAAGGGGRPRGRRRRQPPRRRSSAPTRRRRSSCRTRRTSPAGRGRRPRRRRTPGRRRRAAPPPATANRCGPHRPASPAAPRDQSSWRWVRYQSISAVVDASCCGTSVAVSSGVIRLASALPSSTPHWSKLLTPHTVALDEHDVLVQGDQLAEHGWASGAAP